MTIQESVNALLAQTSRYQKVEQFSKSFRTGDLNNIEVEDEFVIPENYTIISQPIRRNGVPVMMKDEKGNPIPVTAEFIQCMTSSGRIINFFPTSLTKIAFAVDKETGKDLSGSNRVVRTKGDVVDYVRKHPDMNVTMKKLIGCTIKLKSVQVVPVRAFGVSNEQATKDDVQANNIGEWVFVGDKRPDNFAE